MATTTLTQTEPLASATMPSSNGTTPIPNGTMSSPTDTSSRQFTTPSPTDTKPSRYTETPSPTFMRRPTRKPKPSLVDRAIVKIFKGVNKVVSWDKLPPLIGSFNLLALRIELRAKNLFDVYPSPEFQGTKEADPLPSTRYVKARDTDGRFNSLEQPLMGSVGMRFGRNVPRQFTAAPTDEALMTPNPRLISERLLARKDGKFKPATIINLLAAAWIQFQVHDWITHYQSDESVEIPLPPGDTWPSGHMKLPRTKRDIPLDETDRRFPAYKNANTAWWDASQLYGVSEDMTKKLRGMSENGKLEVTEKGTVAFLPRDENGLPLTGFNNNWWIGLELLHTVFVLEHNAICDMLFAKNPTWSSDQLFDTARLINCALMAKIHTVEWTPAILAHPTIQISLDANWWGLIGEKLTKKLGRISKSDVISGIPGSGAEQDGVPYSLTEEFVSVYRLHSLIPDDVAFFSAQSGAHTSTIPIKDVSFSHAQDPLNNGTSFADAFFSFGINYPGAITVNNYPSFLRNLTTPDGLVRDMATVDIVRDRERGVPRYNTFRRLFHMAPAPTFEVLTGGNKELAAELRSIYDDIENVDLLIGCLCEPRPKGFGFSDTAFRVFILMASRRLKSDRFIATDWRPEVYTKEGIAWVQNNSMVTLLCRHYPELSESLKGSKNAFKPWKKTGKAKEYKGKETNA